MGIQTLHVDPNPYIAIDDHGYDGNHMNGTKDRTDKWIGVGQTIMGLTGSMDR